MFKTLRTKKSHQAEEYVNIKTGELLPPETTINSYRPKGIVEIHSELYCTLDLDALKMIDKKISRTDLGTLMVICSQLDSTGVLVYKNDSGRKVSHTLNSLAEVVNITSDRLSMIIKGYKKLGIITRTKLDYVDKTKTVYVVNPTLIRKANKFNSMIQTKFPDLSCELPHPNGGVVKKNAIEQNPNFDKKTS